MASTSTDTTADLKLTSSDSDNNPPGYRPWARLHSTLSLSTPSLSPAEVSEELILRISQLQKPLNPYPPRNPESLKKLKNALSDAKAKAGVSTGSSDTKNLDEPKGIGLLGAPKAGGNPYLALATTNAAKQKGKEKEKDQSENAATLKTDATKADLGSNLNSSWDGPITDTMVENALIISEEFGIDEIESFMLFRSMIYNRGDLRKAASVGSTDRSMLASQQTNEPSTSLALTITSKSNAGSDSADSSTTRSQLIATFAAFYNEELVALLQTLTALCVALAYAEHPFNATACNVLNQVLDLSKLEVSPPNYRSSSSQNAASSPTKTGTVSTIKEKLGLIGPEVTNTPVHPVDFVKDLVAEYAIRAGVPIPSPPPWLTSPLGVVSLADKPRSKYRSNETSQVLLEEHAIMELIFWALWAGVCPPPPVSLDVLTVAYACDLGAKMSPSSNAPSSNSKSYMNGSTSATYLYLEDSDKAVLRRLEMLWLLVTLSLFDIGHLLSGPIDLFPKRSDGTDPDENPKRVYDPRLLPALHVILSNTPPNPRYSPVLLAWGFVLSSVSKSAVSAGENIAKEYIPFLQQIIPEYSIDTIADRLNDAGTWLSSRITSFCITEANVTGYLEVCLRGNEEDEKKGGGLFDGEKGRRNPLSFGPSVYRVVIKRLLLAIPSMLALSRLPSTYAASYLSCFTTLFGHGPSLPELSNDYWDHDMVLESTRVIFDIVRDSFPLAGAAYPLNGGLEAMIRLQRSLSGAGSWELESGDDLSLIAESSLSADRIPGGSYGFYTAAPTKSKTAGGGIATIEASRDESRRFAARAVFHSLDETETYAMVLQQSGPLGFRNLWETGIDNPPAFNGSFSASAGEMYYTNLHPILLPGGSTLPAKSRGYLLSGGSGKPLVIRWNHKHSGWSLLLEILGECAGRLGKSSFNSSMTSPAPHTPPAHVHATPHPQHLKRGSGKPIPFTLSAIGIDFSTIDIPNLVIEILDLFRSVIMHKEDASHVALFESMEQPNDSAMMVEPFEDDQPTDSTHKRKLDLTQVIVQILSDALVRAGSKRAFSNAANSATQQDLKMITSAISALSGVARVLPERVWPLMRSTGLIGLAGGGYGFGASPSNYISTNRNQTSTPQSQSTTIAVLASERATGNYRITLSILSLVRSLFDNAVASDLSTSVRVDLKGEVLTNALRFIHTSIWCEHFSWKYKRLGDRFDIGRRIMGLYCDVLRNWNANEGGEHSTNAQVFRGPAMFLLEVFLTRATQASVTPLVHSINIAQDLSRALKAANRHAEEAELVSMLQCFLDFASLILVRKRTSTISTRQCLLEHLLCTGSSQSSGISVIGSRPAKVVPIDTVANLVSAHGMGANITLYAIELLSSLVLSLANVEPSPPSLVTHMTDAEETIDQLVEVVRSIYQHPKLRKAVWRFMANAVEYQPALATLLVTGSFLSKPYAIQNGKDSKGKTKEDGADKPETSKDKDTDSRPPSKRSAFTVAIQTAPFWEDLWKSDPAVLCAILRFLNVVWRNGLKHSVAIETARKDAPLWKSMTWILRNQLDPASDSNTSDGMDVDGPEKSEAPAYRVLSQAYAVEIFALELGAQRRSIKTPGAATPLAITSGSDASFMAARNLIQVGDILKKHLQNAVANALDVKLQRRLLNQFQTSFPDFFFEALQSPLPSVQRDFGTGYLYSVSLLEPRFIPEMVDRESQNRLKGMLNDASALNCNWSLVDAQIELTRAWKRFLQEGGSILQQDSSITIDLFGVAVKVSQSIAQEDRTGGTMTIVHGERLALLLALLESTWSLSLTSSKEVTRLFTDLLRHIHDIVTSETFPPIDSIRQISSGNGTTFHRQLLQITYFCSRKARTLFKGPSYLSAEQRAVVASTMLAISTFVSTALSEIFEMAKVQTKSWDLDRDMELLITVFEQCTRPELHTSPRLWLERIQELDLARSSLELLVKCDLSGSTMDGATLRTYHHPPYARHILALQLCLSSTSAPAETLALAGAISAYSSISIVNELTVGTLDALHPELPGDRNPGQQAWCTILNIVSGLVGTVGRSSGHFVETEITSFIQLYGAQLSKSLEWNVGQPLSSSALEEMEAIMGLFYSMSLCVNPRSAADVQSLMILNTFAEKSLILLQHLNYALSHPNLLASLFEPTTSEERRALDKEINSSMEMSSATELLDSDKRPFISSLTQRMHVIVRDILSTLVIVNRGDEVIVQEPDDWPSTVQIAPTTKVTVGELATMGTLVEMANGIIELLEYLRPSQKAKLPLVYFTPPFDSDGDILLLAQSLESIAIFSVSQLAVWQHQMEINDPNMDEDGIGADWDDIGFGKESLAVRLGGKRAAILPGLGGDVLADLLAMLGKAKAALSKAGIEKDPSKSMISILERFLDMRVIE